MKRTAIVLLGSSREDRAGVYHLSRGCTRVVDHACALAGRVDPALVVFSGWSPNGGQTEAEQMRARWRGPPLELALEPTASTTVENAVRTLPLLLARRIDHAIVVCTPLHLFRARWFFRQLYGTRGVGTSFQAPRHLPTPSAFVWELAALTVRARHLRSGKDELEHMRQPHD